MRDHRLPSWLVLPPSVDELVTDDGEPMETERHREQMTLLIESLKLAWSERRDFYVGGNMFLYYSALQARGTDFRGPDVFVALDVERRQRKAWVVWEENGKIPDVIVELTSESTTAVDHGAKMQVYGTLLHVSEYFIFDPWTGAFEGHRLDIRTHGYRPLAPTATGRLPSFALGLELGTWHGTHADEEADWLRWFRPDGTMLPSPQEAAATAERQRDEVQRQRDEAQRQRDEVQRQRDEAQRQRDEAQRQRDEAARARDEAARARDEAARARDDLAARLAQYEARFGKIE